MGRLARHITEMPLVHISASAIERAYRSQFQTIYNRGHAGKAKIKARLIGDLDPEEWDLPPKPKWMRQRTYDRLVERFEAYDDMTYPDESTLFELAARLMRRSR